MQNNTSLSPSNAWIGIDVSKGKLDACLIRESGKGIFKLVTNDPTGHAALLKWAQSHSRNGVRHFCLEATGRYGFDIAEMLGQAGERVSMVNPTTVKYSGPGGSSNKTDKADARKIALFAKKENPAIWIPASEEVALLRAMTRHLDDLTEDRTRHQNRLGEPNHPPVVLASIQKVVDILNSQIDDIRKQIESHIKDHPQLRENRDLLLTIPGVGEATARTLLAEMPDISNVDSAQSLAAFFGLSPRQNQSGVAVGRTRISKKGSSNVRAKLYWPAVTAMTYNPRVRALTERLNEAKKKF